MANPWFRMYAEFASDPKVQMLSEPMQRRLVMLFCMRCSDVTVTLSDEEMAFHLRISVDELAQTKALFIDKGFIDSAWNISNWDKRQKASDTSAARTREYRERRRDMAVTSHVTERDVLDKKRIEDKEQKLLPSADADDSNTQPPTCPHQQIIALYHEHLPANPRIKVWGKDRAASLQARWREDPKRQDPEYWARFFRHCAASRFLTGRADGNGRPFLPGLEWLVKASNFAKIIEGRYHERGQQ